MQRNATRETIAVLFGGRSVEHEVSVITGHQTMDALEVAGYAVLPIYITKEGAWYAGQSLHNMNLYKDLSTLNTLPDVYRVSLSPDRSIRQLLPHPNSGRRLFKKKMPRLWADVFVPVIHGSFGEDGTLQGLFEMADVPYVGSGVLASTVGMDKVGAKAVYRDADLPVLDCIEVSRAEWKRARDAFVRRAEDFSRYPLMVKPVCLGSSIGVRRCDNAGELREAIEAAVLLNERVLVERALVDFIEINCAVIGPPEHASVCEQPCSSEAMLSFDDKYKRAGKKVGVAGTKGGMASQERMIPAPISAHLTSRLQELAIRAFHVIGASGVARVDFLLETAKENLYINEINTMPGSFAFYLWEASGIPFDELMRRVVNIALDQHRIRTATQFTFAADLLQSK